MTEEYVLKDTEENRQLQRDLAQKAQLQLYVFFKPNVMRSSDIINYTSLLYYLFKYVIGVHTYTAVNVRSEAIKCQNV